MTALVPEAASNAGWRRSYRSGRVARFGFTQTELDRQRLSLLKPSSSSPLRTRDTSASLADEFVRNFVQRSRFRASRTSTACAALPAGDHARRRQQPGEHLVPDRNRVVVVSAPKKPDRASLTKRSLRP